MRDFTREAWLLVKRPTWLMLHTIQIIGTCSHHDLMSFLVMCIIFFVLVPRHGSGQATRYTSLLCIRVFKGYPTSISCIFNITLTYVVYRFKDVLFQKSGIYMVMTIAMIQGRTNVITGSSRCVSKSSKNCTFESDSNRGAQLCIYLYPTCCL